MKKLLSIIFACFMLMNISGCNQQVFDTTLKYNKAIIYLPDGTIVSGEVQSWTDYSDGDQLQVKINGSTYLTHSSNVVLIHE